jgi:hypothetical protein
MPIPPLLDSEHQEILNAGIVSVSICRISIANLLERDLYSRKPIRAPLVLFSYPRLGLDQRQVRQSAALLYAASAPRQGPNTPQR